MREPIISIHNLSKRYKLGQDQITAAELARGLLRGAAYRLGRPIAPEPDSAFIWALRDINLNIADGERVGIIGKNGAGKSTLLKILSRVVYPTSGEARIRGRVTSLLEVGTGFSEDLTGRENIFLNASLHGLSREEIEARLDDIIAFSEIARFIDTPIKHYSSGMRMRLAFSVAAHLDPDILMLDEVLAVGDLSFQRKCLDRMGEMTSRGRTLLFVSHSIDAISRFCDRCVWMEQGRVRADGPVTQVTEDYVQSALGISSSVVTSPEGHAISLSVADIQDRACLNDNKEKVLTGQVGGVKDRLDLPTLAIASADSGEDEQASLIDGCIVNGKGEPTSVAHTDQKVGIRMRFRVHTPGMFVPAIALHGADGALLFWAVPGDTRIDAYRLSPGSYTAIASISANFLNVGTYSVTLALVGPDRTPMHRYFVLERAVRFYAVDPSTEGFQSRGALPRDFPGPLRPLLDWQFQNWDGAK